MNKKLMVVCLLAASACAAADDTARSISVTGTGSAEATPDRATIIMSIVARDKALSVAQQNAATVTAKVLKITDGLKIDRSRVDTTGASVRPDYRYNRQTTEQELRGYIAERRIKVEFRNLENLAKVIEGAVAAGVNQVLPPQLFSSERREAHRNALENAALDARANAARLADALDMSLGPVISINTGGGATPFPAQRGYANAMAVESDAGATYNPGDMSVHTTVSAVFELHPKP